MLIKRIDPNNMSDEEYSVSISISKMNDEGNIKKVANILDESGYVKKKSIIFRYNGIEIRTKIKNIPKIIKVLVNNDIEIYNVFIKYVGNY